MLRVKVILIQPETHRIELSLEIAPNGKVFDYKAEFYRKFDTTWHLKDVKLLPNRQRQRLCNCEGRLPITEMKKLRLDLQKGFHMGVYRADCMSLGDSFDWYTWIDPLNKTPDFHVPSSFQLCRDQRHFLI